MSAAGDRWRTRWFAGLAPEEGRTVGVVCGAGPVHRVTWRRGKLVLPDHDLRDELGLLALGGEPPPCVAMLLAWRDSAGWQRAMRPRPAGFVRVPPGPLNIVADPTLTGLRRLGVVRSWERHLDRGRDAHRGGGVDAAVTTGLADDLHRVLVATAAPIVTAFLMAGRRAAGSTAPVRFVEVDLLRRPDDSEDDAGAGVPSVRGGIDERGASLVVVLPASWLYTSAGEAAVEADAGRLVVAPGTVVGWRPTGPATAELVIVEPMAADLDGEAAVIVGPSAVARPADVSPFAVRPDWTRRPFSLRA